MPMWSETAVNFEKTGAEVKTAIESRLADLASRLRKRDAELNEVMADSARLRSYLVRDRDNDNYYRGSQFKGEIPSEDHQRITELCTRICLIEKDLSRLSVIRDNTKDDQVFKLSYEELVDLGFGPSDPVN